MDEKNDPDVMTPSSADGAELADGDSQSKAEAAEHAHKTRLGEGCVRGGSSRGAASSLAESFRRRLGGAVAYDSPRRLRPPQYSSTARENVSPGEIHTVADRDEDQENGSAGDNSKSPASTQRLNSISDCFTMEQAISTGAPEQVLALLDRLHKTSAIRQLTRCYGGRAVGINRCPDKNGLFRMTVPLLHIAYTGNTSMFSIVYSAMRDKLRTQQVKRAIIARDEGSRSVLAMAVASRNEDMVEAVLVALEERLTDDEVKETMMAGFGEKENTLLHWAAASGSKDVFEATLAALQRHLTRDEIKGLMTYSERRPGLMIDSDSAFEEEESIMKCAAIGGNKDNWNAVLAQLELSMSEVEVRLMLGGKDGRRGTVLNAAVRSGSVRAFEAVVTAMNRLLTQPQREMVMSNDAAGFNILHTAAECGNTEIFKAALTALRHELPRAEVDKLAKSRKTGGMNILHSAAGSGNRDMFGAVLEILDEQDAETMLLDAQPGAVASVLHAAAGSASKDTFAVVLAALQKKLDQPHVKSIFASTGIIYGPHSAVGDELGHHHSTVLHSAASRGSKEVFEAVMAAVDNILTPQEAKTMMTFTGRPGGGRSILHSAADSGSKDVIEAVFTAIGQRLTHKEVKSMITLDGEDGLFGKESILHLAVTSGSKEALEASLADPAAGIPVLKVKDLLIATAKKARGLLKYAAGSGSAELWQTVMREAGQELLFDVEEAEDLLVLAAGCGCADMWGFVAAAAIEALGARLPDMLCQEPAFVLKAIDSKDPTTVELVYSFVQKMIPVEEAGGKTIGRVVAAGFTRWTEHVLGDSMVGLSPVGTGGLGWAIEVLACLLRYPAELKPSDLEELSRKTSNDWIGICFLETMACVDNPFVAGMTLSVALAKAAVVAPGGERRKLLSLQNKVDALLFEILERLPQNVQSFRGGMAGCSAVLEPEVVGGDTRGLVGPLSMILRHRAHMETFCTQPLIVDFMWRRFTHGLPDLLDTKGILDDAQEVEILSGGSTVGDDYYLLTDEQKKIEDDLRVANSLAIGYKDRLAWAQPIHGKAGVFGALLSPCIMLQGVNLEDFSMTSFTVLPGAQFIFAGLAAMPDAYYRVPAMRMVLDLLGYLGMVAVFSSVVLFHEDGPPTTGELVFAFYILAGAMTEVREMKRSFKLYVADYWNPIDFLGFGLVASGLIVRFAEGSSPWGRILYALGAPLIFSRVLFFAQMLRFQGPMVQVIFSVIWELAEFGVMILVIMLGFAMSFHALFRDVDSFGQTVLTLFKGTLGELGYFNEFLGNEYNEEYEEVATALFIIYLVVIAVVLLNLLIAVLSTSLVKVQDKADQEFRVSRARLIDHYRLVVNKHLLPAPFNIVQAALALPFLVVDRNWHGVRCTHAKELVGRIVFWLVMGLVAVLSGTTLWVISVLYAPFAWSRHRRRVVGESPPVSVAFQFLAIMLWCVLGAPLYLVMFWLTAPLKWVGLQPWARLWKRRELSRHFSSYTYVDDVLTDRSGGLSAGQLQEFLEDPMSDPQVRQDEKRRPTTVEHMKLLRDRLEKTIDVHQDQFEARVGARLASLENQVAASQDKLDKVLAFMKELATGAHANTVGS